jgi:hypothetical protein
MICEACCPSGNQRERFRRKSKFGNKYGYEESLVDGIAVPPT